MLPASSSLSAGTGNEWVPVNPASDLALAMGLIRWILDNERHDARALAQPGPQAMKAGEAAWTNATHLVVAEPGHPRMGSFLRGADLGWAKPADADEKWEDVYVVRLADGTLAPHTVAAEAQLYVEDAWTRARRAACAAPVAVREEARRKTLDEYAALCGVPATRSPNWPGASPATAARRGRCPRRHDERRGLLHRLCHRHAGTRWSAT